MASRIIGGPDLKARLASIPAGAPDLVDAWAVDAVTRMRNTAPNARRPASRRWDVKVSGVRAAIYGAFWWIFVDRGTKAHDIVPRKAQALKFERAGRTVFAKKVHRKRMARRPFITKAAQEALASSGLQDSIIKLWNRRRLGSSRRFI